MMFVRAFEPDEDYDRDHASNGTSRFAAYLAQHNNLFAEEGRLTTDPEMFAAVAWRIAQAPTMVPGYVRPHGRVQGTTVHWDQDSRPAVCVELATSSAPEAACLTFPWRRWTRDEQGRWLPPEDYARPAALTVLSVAVPLSGVSLPPPRYHGARPDTDTAKQAVQLICRTLNAALVHVLTFDPLAGSSR